MRSLQGLLKNQGKLKALDNMVGFRERTPVPQLKQWERNLNINSKILTSQVNTELEYVMTAKEERRMVKEIKNK